MYMILRRISLVFFLLCAVALTDSFAQRAFQNGGIKGKHVQFGSGGGFTGASKEYILSEDGKLYKHTENLQGISSDTLLKKISHCKTKKIFTYISKNGLTNIGLDKPSNIYSFITIYNIEGPHRLTWSKPEDAPSTVIHLDTLLRSLL